MLWRICTGYGSKTGNSKGVLAVEDKSWGARKMLVVTQSMNRTNGMIDLEKSPRNRIITFIRPLGKITVPN